MILLSYATLFDNNEWVMKHGRSIVRESVPFALAIAANFQQAHRFQNLLARMIQA